MALYLDLHLLHSVGYANLNRDDLGSPKTVRFGYTDRTRVSSQCWKRAVREELERRTGERAKRTRRVPQAVAGKLRDRGWDPEEADFAGEQVMAALGTVAVKADGLKLDKETREAQVLFYVPETAFDRLADVCVAHRAELVDTRTNTKKKVVLPALELQAIIADRNPVINLFGRMLAELPSTNVDGAVQVAHAFTVHGSDPQVDFFTAVDDLKRDEELAGSGHMNSAEFSAGTFYRYTTVNVTDLTRNTGDPATALELSRQFLSCFIAAMPQAKKNSTAPFTVPDLAYLAVRTDRPVSLASAFETPVSAYGANGYAEPARRQLADYTHRIHRLLGSSGRSYHAHAGIDDKVLAGLGDRVDSFDQLLDNALDHARAA